VFTTRLEFETPKTNIVAYLPFLILPGNTVSLLYSLPVVLTCSLVASRLEEGFAILECIERREEVQLARVKRRAGDFRSVRLECAAMQAGTQSSTLLYALHDRMPHGKAALVGLQHVTAMFIGIITPPLIISRALNYSTSEAAYLVSMALLASGLSTFIQVRKIGPLGSGLLSVQGTSFSFLPPLIQAGQLGGMALMMGMSLWMSPVEMALSRFLKRLSHIFTPLVSGIVVLMIGLSLVPVGAKAVASGLGPNAPGWAGLAVAGLVIAVVIALHALHKPWARISAVAVALAVGYVICAATGHLQTQTPIAGHWMVLPVPFKSGLAFRWELLLPFFLIYVLTTIETMGDLTATSQLSREPIEGDLYWKRISDGVLADGFNSALAVACNSFPNTTFSQNNGVIQLTGVASRQAGYWVAGFLCVFGVFPFIGNWIAIMPGPVLGGVTLLLFGFVAAAGIRILNHVSLTHRDMLILASSLAAGVSVMTVPEVLGPLPEVVRNSFKSAIATGGLTALVLNAVVPGSHENRSSVRGSAVLE
jgi:xanthine permease XanP